MSEVNDITCSRNLSSWVLRNILLSLLVRSMMPAQLVGNTLIRFVLPDAPGQ